MESHILRVAMKTSMLLKTITSIEKKVGILDNVPGCYTVLHRLGNCSRGTINLNCSFGSTARNAHRTLPNVPQARQVKATSFKWRWWQCSASINMWKRNLSTTHLLKSLVLCSGHERQSQPPLLNSRGH